MGITVYSNSLISFFQRYQVDYQIGVFISRSSANIFPIKKIWILAILQVSVFVGSVGQLVIRLSVSLSFAVLCSSHGLMLETSALKLLTMANSRHQLS